MTVVCFDMHFSKFEAQVTDPVTGDRLDRYAVFHESGDLRARFTLPAGREPTRWEIQAAAKEALRAFERRARQPARLKGAA